MSTRRVTRSATTALKEPIENAASVSFADGEAESTKADVEAVPARKLAVIIKAKANGASEKLGINADLADTQKASESTKAKVKIVLAKKRTTTSEIESASKRTKASSQAEKPAKAAKQPKIIVKRAWTLPHGMGSTLPTTNNAGSSSDGSEAFPSSNRAAGPVITGEAKLAPSDQDNDAPMLDMDDTSSNNATIKPAAAAQLGISEAPKRLTRGAAKRTKTVDTGVQSNEDDTSKTADVVDPSDKSMADFRKKTKRGTANKYGLTRGYSPYPYRTVPTKEQCEEVHRILVETHGMVTQPTNAPPPSLEVAGCGEVPAVLDGLCRTLISGNTLMAHADKAIVKLAETYGVLKHGVGAGSIDWNAVWLEPKEKLVDTIRIAGCSDRKAGHIKAILEMVHKEQEARALAHMVGAPVAGAQNEDDKQMALEVQNAVDDYLSLEHVRAMTADEALTEFLRFPGIGVKTAACVVLFTLRFPCFAVDTHVHKFCKWLGWVPEKASDIDAFNHGEHMVPDHLKYALHQLFIRHGQDCFKCRKNTKPGSDGWNEAPDCPLEHLLDRNKAVTEEQEEVDVEEEQAAKGKERADDNIIEAENKPKRGKGKKKDDGTKVEEGVAIQEDTADEVDKHHHQSKPNKAPKKDKGAKGRKVAKETKVQNAITAKEEQVADAKGDTRMEDVKGGQEEIKGDNTLMEQTGTRRSLRPRRRL